MLLAILLVSLCVTVILLALMAGSPSSAQEREADDEAQQAALDAARTRSTSAGQTQTPGSRSRDV